MNADNKNNELTIEVNGWADKQTRLTRDQYLARWEVCTHNDVINLIAFKEGTIDQTNQLIAMRDAFDELKAKIVNANFDAVVAAEQIVSQAKITAAKEAIDQGDFDIDNETVARSFASIEGLGSLGH